MLEGLVTLFWSLAGAAAFASPGVVGKYSPEKYLAFASAITAGSGLALFCTGIALMSYGYGYRAALTDAGATLPVSPLLEGATMATASIMICLVVYLIGVWFYWFYAVKPRL